MVVPLSLVYFLLFCLSFLFSVFTIIHQSLAVNIWLTLPGQGYSSRKNSITHSYLRVP